MGNFLFICIFIPLGLSLKVALLDSVSPMPLKQMGLEVVKINENPNILICRGSKVTKEDLSVACPDLKMVVRAGAGFNNIDIAAATKLGIAVCNCPGQNAIAVSELVFGLIISLDRRIQESHQLMKKGVWDKSTLSRQQRGLYSNTLGVIGCGNIGQQVIRRAAAFGMDVNVWSRKYNHVKVPTKMTIEEATSMGLEWCLDMIDIMIMPSVVSVARNSNIMTIHVQPNEETKHLIDFHVLQAMPDDTILINTARNDILDVEALIKFYDQYPDRNLRVGLDVWKDETVDGFAKENVRVIELMNREGSEVILGTPHTGASTIQAQEAVSKEMLRIVNAYVNGGVILNQVN